MAVYQSQPVETTAPAGSSAVPDSAQGSQQGTVLLVALLVACAYAIFAHGAQSYPYETRVQVAVAVGALVAMGAWAAGRGILAEARPGTRAGIALLVAFGAWNGLTLLWSVTPDRTWTEINRALAYALVAGLAVAAGASAPRAIERLANGWLIVATLVALFALAGKVIPGFHMLGIDLRDDAVVPRLRAPLDYWNALALICALAIPIGMKVAADASRRPAGRIGALLSLYVLVIVTGLTYSRGGLLAIGTALIVMTLLGTGRLRALLALGVVLLAATEPLGLSFTKESLKTSNAPLGERIEAGNLLLSSVVGCAIVLVAAGLALIAAERHVRWTAADSRAVWRVAAVLAAVAVLGGTAVAAASHRGLPATVQNAVASFTATKQDKQLDPERLASGNSGNRWVWWKEAVGAWSDRPLHGWGGGSFRATHLLFRKDTLPVTQPHSVPLQFLAETGLIGFMLAFGGIGALLWAAFSRVRTMARRPQTRERELAVALLAATCGWLAHGLYDWDWDIPAVTFPAMLFLGVLAAGRSVSARAARRTPRGPRVVFVDPSRMPGMGASRAVGVAAATVALALYVASAVLPSWSDSKAASAQAAIGAGQPTADQLKDAAAQARIATRLDPLSVNGLFVSAVIASRRERPDDAREALLEAVKRQPDNARAWSELARFALFLGDRNGLLRASLRALEVDPMNPSLKANALRAVALMTPAASSASAVPTPLVAAVVAPVGPTGPTGPAGPAG